MSDRKAVIRAVGRLFEAFQREADDLALETWLGGLADLDSDDVQRGILEAIRTCRRFPTIAEVRDLAGHSIAAQTQAAWELVLAHIHSGYKLGVPAEVEACVQAMGGWDRFGMTDRQTLRVWVRKEWEERFPVVLSSPGLRTLGRGRTAALGQLLSSNQPLLTRGSAGSQGRPPAGAAPSSSTGAP